MLRAINKIGYRWYNDGDYFYTGYGTETAGPAHSFLVNSHEIPSDIQRKLKKIFHNANGATEHEYEKYLDQAIKVVVEYIESLDGNYTESNEDMYNYDAEFEDREQDFEDDEFEFEDDELTEIGKLNERNWALKIKLSNEWNKLNDYLENVDADDDFQLDEERERNPEFKALYDAFIDRLSSYIDKVKNIIGDTSEFESYIMNLEDAVSIYDFDVVWDELYDWADDNSIFIYTM